MTIQIRRIVRNKEKKNIERKRLPEEFHTSVITIDIPPIPNENRAFPFTDFLFSQGQTYLILECEFH